MSPLSQCLPTTRDSCGAASDLRVKAFGSATHVVIEVQGYYIKPMAAVVSSTGALVTGSRVFAFNLAGDGLRDALDPRSASR